MCFLPYSSLDLKALPASSLDLKAQHNFQGRTRVQYSTNDQYKRMITLHHLKHSQSFRIVWLLEEMKMEYTLKVYERLPNYLAPDEYKAMSPLGTAPVITTENGLHLSESNAIIDYILDNTADGPACNQNLRPAAGDPARADYLFWFHASAASLQPILNTDTIFRLLPKQTSWPISAILRKVQSKVDENYVRPRLTTILQLAEAQLTKHEYLAGSAALTAADITAVYSFDSVFTRTPATATQYPACKAWFDRMQKREAFQAALNKVGQTSINS